MIDRLRKLLMGEPPVMPKHPELDEREAVIDEKLAHAFDRSAAEIRHQARLRALRIEAESMPRRQK